MSVISINLVLKALHAPYRIQDVGPMVLSRMQAETARAYLVPVVTPALAGYRSTTCDVRIRDRMAQVGKSRHTQSA